MSESADSLVEQILDDARGQAERKKKKARRQAEKTVEQAREEAEKERQRILDEADSQAEAEEEKLRAGISQEKRFLRQKVLQELLEHVRERCMERLAALRKQEDYRDILLYLATEALAQMEGKQFVLVLPPEDQEELGDELARALPDRAAEELDRNVDVTLSRETVDACGGLKLMRQDGKEICDETFEARMKRLWPELRHTVATRLTESRAWQQDGAGENQPADESHDS